jgi:hypothetical protein
LAEFLAPHRLGAGKLSLAQLRAGLFDERLIDGVLLQLADDPVRAQTRCAAMDQAFCESGVGQPVLSFQRVEQGIERISFFDEGFELARELAAAVLATG